MKPSLRRAETMKKPAVLLSIVALATVLNLADAVPNPEGTEISFLKAVPYALARDQLIARAISCENMLCLERMLNDELIQSAVRMTEKMQKEQELKGKERRHFEKIEPHALPFENFWTETSCYYERCSNTCFWWLDNGGVPQHECDGISQFRRDMLPSEPDSSDSLACYNPGERSEGAEGYPKVLFKPCCDGRAYVEIVDEWGKFCPVADSDGDRGDGSDGDDVGYDGDGAQDSGDDIVDGSGGGVGDGGDNGNGSSDCYGPGMRSVGAPGYSSIDARPCCDGGTPMKRAGEWGMFCPDDSEKEAQEDTSETYTQTVRTRLLQLTRSCVAMETREAVECMQNELDDILSRAIVKQEGSPPSFLCPTEDKYYRCQCSKTCTYWFKIVGSSG